MKELRNGVKSLIREMKAKFLSQRRSQIRDTGRILRGKKTNLTVPKSSESVQTKERPWCWERLRTGREGATENEMVGWHHWLNGHEFEQTRGDSEGQGSLACCSSWGHKELDTT